jgi:hypothetical protein
MFIANVMAQQAWHGAKRARMLMRLKSWTVQRHFIGIKADARPSLGKTGLEVFLAGHEVNRTGLRLVRQNKIQQRVFRRFLPSFGHVLYSLAFKLLQFGILY